MSSQGASKMQSNSSQLKSNSLQNNHNPIKSFKFKISPIHTKPIQQKVAKLKKPTDCIETSLQFNPLS